MTDLQISFGNLKSTSVKKGCTKSKKTPKFGVGMYHFQNRIVALNPSTLGSAINVPLK